jgi:glycosyltransferase involved in cell wall biosynthesis
VQRRIAVNGAIIGRWPTGLAVYALGVIRALAALREEVVVFTSRADAVTGQAVRIYAAPAAARPEYGAAGHLIRLLWTQTGLRAGVRKTRSDVIFNPLPEGVLRPTVPQVTTVLDLLPLRYPEEYPRQQYYFRHYVPAVLRSSRAIVTISESTRRDVMVFYPQVSPDQMHLAPPGYDAERFSPDGPVAEGLGRPYVLYVGNIMPHKNLVRLVEAFAKARRQVPARLVIRGNGHARHVESVRRSIETQGLGADVDWKPYAPAEELPPLYRGARALLLPSLYEGFGMTALEAMACGTPVIASQTSSLPEVVGDAGLLIDPLDTSALAKAIVRVLSDDVLARTLRTRGLARVAAFSWERTGRAVQRALDTALGR